jgi:hypothetical protein
MTSDYTPDEIRAMAKGENLTEHDVDRLKALLDDERRVRKYECTYCPAKPGQACDDGGGERARSHTARYLTAIAVEGVGGWADNF